VSKHRAKSSPATTPSSTVTAPLLAGGGGGGVLSVRTADVGLARESLRRRRLFRIIAAISVVLAYFGFVALLRRPLVPFPTLDPITVAAFLPMLLIVIGGGIYFWLSGKSPHVIIRPEQIDVRLAHVVGIDPVKEEVVRSLNLFLSHQTFADRMGGRPRRGLLFEGAPGTGKTFLAKAMAAEAGVPFLFATATSFQSSFYGATARKIRSFFSDLRRVARAEGGAIAFIDEFDAIGGRRSGMEMTPAPDLSSAIAGCGGLSGLGLSPAGPMHSVPMGRTTSNFGTSDLAGPVVNELLVQMQSFDTPTQLQRMVGTVIDKMNLVMPAGRQIPKPKVKPANILVIAATNRADGLDPALLRPGRFDRRLTFELPGKSGRRELVDHFLKTKAHAPELDDPQRRDALAAITNGYSPAMLEGLFDESLVNAVRREAETMNWADIEGARLMMEVGVGQPFAYTEHERELIATHEAGHTAVAWLVAPQRRLEVLSIIKRRGSLGLLAHGDREDVFTRSRAEMKALMQIAFGGQVAEDLFFGDISTGPAGDLAYATNIAVQMVGAAGMTGTLASFSAVQAGAFADTNLVGRVLADGVGRAAVEELLGEQKAAVIELLNDNRHLVEALRDALLDRDELIGTEITDVLEAAAMRHTVIDLRDPEDTGEATGTLLAGDLLVGDQAR
jgi:cell division protease FtsH